MSFGFITFNLSCLNNSKLINEKVYACDNSFKPSLSCFLEDHTLCPYLKWTIVKDAELITDENGNVIKCDKTVNKMINHLVAIEGYCFHDEDDNYKFSNVPYASSIPSFFRTSLSLSPKKPSVLFLLGKLPSFKPIINIVLTL